MEKKAKIAWLYVIAALFVAVGLFLVVKKNTYLFFQLFFSQNFSNPVCKNIDKIREIMSPGISDVLSQFESKIYERGFTIHEKRK